MRRYNFQQEGAAWLAGRRHALLADEMGLGKTVQAIDAADQANADRILVLCKAVARRHWASEFQKWSDKDRTIQLILPGDTPDPDAQVHVINYDIAHRPEILGRLVKLRWDVLIADEMHSLKAGRDSLRGQVVLDPRRGLWRRAEHVWGLSGTPAPNHAGDLHPWLSTLHPELLGPKLAGSYDEFLKHYCRAQPTPYGWRVRGNKPGRGRELRELLSGVLLRRKRADVLPDLPPLSVDTRALDAEPDRDLAELESHPEYLTIRSVLLGMDPEAHPVEASEAWGQELSTLRRLTGLAKARATAELAAEELTQRSKLTIYGWHPEVLDELGRALSDYQPLVVHGGTPAAEKEQAAEQFQSDPTRRVFIGQIQSAGTSITLTAASRMLICEPSWVPGENEQAILRILRIGQTSNCEVSFLALPGTIDEIVQAVFARKAQAINEFLS